MKEDNPKLRIAFIRQAPFPDDPRVRKEVKALLEVGFEIDVICTAREGEKRFELWKGVRIFRVPLGHRRGRIFRYLLEYIIFFIRASFLISRLHFRRKYHAIQVNTLPDFLVFSTFIPKILGAKVFLDFHEVTSELMKDAFLFSNTHPLVRISKFVEKLAIKYSDWVFVAGPTYLRHHIKRGLDQSKVTIVHNVPDEEIFKPQKKEEKRDKRNIFVIHGSILKRYGIQVAVEAMQIILKKFPESELRITGDGEYAPTIKELVSKLNLENKVILMGKIPIEELLSLLRKADIGMIPLIDSPYTRIMSPNKLFELVALRIPVVASRLEGMTTYFDEESVCYVEPGQPVDLAKKVINLLKEEKKRKSMVERAFKIYDNYRWNKTKKDYREAILRCISKKKALH